MATSTQQLSEEIAANRARMGETLDEVEGRVHPRQAWERRKPMVSSKAQQLKDTVMGTAGDAADRAQGGAASVRDRAATGTQGNPLAAGLIAFGAGMLAGSVFPSTRREGALVSDLQDEVEGPMRRSLGESADEVRERVGGRAEEAAGHTKEAAQQSTESVKGSAQESAENLRDESRRAAEDVRRDVEGS